MSHRNLRLFDATRNAPIACEVEVEVNMRSKARMLDKTTKLAAALPLRKRHADLTPTTSSR